MLFTGAKKSTVFICLTVLILGAVFRLYDLGNPGFWGDEETSSMPAKSFALGQGAVFPSGMEYRRALPHTTLNSISAKIFGLENDLSYRVPSAIFGIATLILIFLGTVRLFGVYVALTVTALLAFSEWHVILSRTARMYGPLLFFSISFCFAALSWHYNSNRNTPLVVACFLYLVASIFNFLTIIVLPILFIPVIFEKFDKKKFTLSLLATSILGIISIIYFKLFVNVPFKEILKSRQLQNSSDNNSEFTFFNILSNLNTVDFFLLPISLVLGSYTFYKLNKYIPSEKHPLLSIGIIIFTTLFFSFIFHGEVYGAVMSMAFILIFVSSQPNADIKLIFKPFIITLTAVFFVVLINIYYHGMVNGFKESFNYPFPYLLYQSLQFPGVIILFAIGILDSVFSPINSKRKIIKSLAIAILVPTFFLGLILNWAPPRYFVTLYPLLLIVASYGLVRLFEMIPIFKTFKKLKLIIFTTIAASGILGGHGIPQSIAVSPSEYGSTIYSNHVTGINYPDHRSNGCFVKSNLRDSDIVVAEDALQMHWYIGRVDYWLRTPKSIDGFLYSDGGSLKDIYVNSKPTTKQVINDLQSNKKDRIWLITSGETQQFLDNFLNEDSPQRRWLFHVTNTYNPVLNGRDGLSATYCLNCNLKDFKADPWNYDCR